MGRHHVDITFRLPLEDEPWLYRFSGTHAAHGRCSACEEPAVVFVDLPHARFGTYTRGFCAVHLARYRRRRRRWTDMVSLPVSCVIGTESTVHLWYEQAPRRFIANRVVPLYPFGGQGYR